MPRSTHCGEPPDGRTGWRQFDSHIVNTEGVLFAGKRSNLALLTIIEVEDRVALTFGETGFHLNGHTLAIDHHHEIDFATTHANVATDNGSSAAQEKAGGYSLAESTDLSPAQRAEVGSSSSMLTSRKVITLTLLTNRAGRYISHTHASFNSSSK